MLKEIMNMGDIVLIFEDYNSTFFEGCYTDNHFVHSLTR
jgi:hypothetical protein